MYIVRDIFHLKFGHYRDAKSLLEDANKQGILPEAQNMRILSDFTGEAYRLIFEEGHNTMADYEQFLGESMSTAEWQEWYEQFKQHVHHSEREILKQVM